MHESNSTAACPEPPCWHPSSTPLPRVHARVHATDSVSGATRRPCRAAIALLHEQSCGICALSCCVWPRSAGWWFCVGLHWFDMASPAPLDLARVSCLRCRWLCVLRSRQCLRSSFFSVQLFERYGRRRPSPRPLNHAAIVTHSPCPCPCTQMDYPA